MDTLYSETSNQARTDRMLLDEFVVSRSTEAFAELMRRHGGMVLSVCERQLGRGSESEDAAQSVFIQMWQKAKELTKHGSIVGWLHVTAVNVCCNHQRSRAARLKHERLAASVNNRSLGPTETDWLAVREILDHEISSLPAKLRVPLILFHLEGRRLNEVAAELNTTVSTVGTWLARARIALAGKLKRHGLAIGTVTLSELLSQQAHAAEVDQCFIEDTIQMTAQFVGDHADNPGEAIVGLALQKWASRFISIKFWGWAVGLSMIAAFALVLMLPMYNTWRSPDFPLLQGAWKAVAEERDGKPFAVENPIKVTNWLIVSGHSFRRVQELEDGRRIVSETGSFLLADDHEQPAIDFRLWQGSVLGIYELKGDQLTLCLGEAVGIGDWRTVGSRPDEFATSKGDGRRLVRYEKVE